MAISSSKKYLLVYASISFRNNIALLKRIQKEFGFEIPYLDIPYLSEELRGVLDSYLYLDKDLVNKNIFTILYSKYKSITFTDLGYIDGSEIYNLINNCVSDVLNSIKIGNYYKIIKHFYKNLTIKVVGINKDTVVGEYSVLDENRRIEVPIKNIKPFNNVYLINKETQFINYEEVYKKMNINKAVIIDGHNILYKNMFGRSNIYTAKDHIFVGGAYGMYFSLLKLKELFPEYEIHLVFDGYDENKFQANPDYKIHRQKHSAVFKEAFSNNLWWVREFARCLGFYIYHLPDKEGDDVIGSIANFLETELKYKYILINSIDKDFYSIVTDIINLYVPRFDFRGVSKRVDKAGALEKFGVNEIRKINWVKSITGDGSDSILSVNMYNHDNGLKCSRIKKQHYISNVNESDSFEALKSKLSLDSRFEQYIESGQMDKSLKLLTINTHLFKNKCDLSEFKGICNYDKAVELLEEFSFYKELEMFEKNYRIFKGVWSVLLVMGLICLL